MGLGGKPAEGVSRAEIDTAAQNGDFEFLHAVCSGEKPVNIEANKGWACNQLEKLEPQAKALAADCESVVQAYEDSHNSDRAYVAKMARKFADCGHYTALFEHVVYWGTENDGKEMLDELEQAGLPVEEKWLEYLATHKGESFFALEHENSVIYGLKHIGLWLLEKGKNEHCAVMVESATGASEIARSAITSPYLEEAGCKEGVPIMVSLLLSDTPTQRWHGCRALGLVGDPSVLAKLDTLAEGDGHWELVEVERGGEIYQVKSWPVREVCKEAAAKIKLRTE
jgi:hypothetical protein